MLLILKPIIGPSVHFYYAEYYSCVCICEHAYLLICCIKAQIRNQLVSYCLRLLIITQHYLIYLLIYRQRKMFCNSNRWHHCTLTFQNKLKRLHSRYNTWEVHQISYILTNGLCKYLQWNMMVLVLLCHPVLMFSIKDIFGLSCFLMPSARHRSFYSVVSLLCSVLLRGQSYPVCKF